MAIFSPLSPIFFNHFGAIETTLNSKKYTIYPIYDLTFRGPSTRILDDEGPKYLLLRINANHILRDLATAVLMI